MKKFIFILVLIILCIFGIKKCRQNYYYNEHIDFTGPGGKNIEKTYTKREQYNEKKEIHKDSLYVELNTIYLISSGGIIKATCKDGYKIFIEKQDKQTAHYYTQLHYTFKNKQDYLQALDYIKQKGYRWIINNQFTEEYHWNIKQEMKYEHNPDFKQIHIVKLDKMYHANWE